MPRADLLRKASWIAAVLLGCALLISCQGGGGATHTVESETQYYLDGPQQARPPDGSLAAGTSVTLVNASGSYAQVVLPDGRKAYVAADSLRPLR